MDDDFDDFDPEVRESIQSIIKKLTVVRVKEEMDQLKTDIRDQLADQKTQVQILIGHHATQRGSSPTNPLLDNRAVAHGAGFAHPWHGAPYYGAGVYPGGHYPPYHYGDPYYRARGYHHGYAPGYLGELRDPYYYPPAYRYVSPERRKNYAMHSGIMPKEGLKMGGKTTSGYNTAIVTSRASGPTSNAFN